MSMTSTCTCSNLYRNVSDFIRRLLHLRSDQEPPTLGAQPARQQALFERLRSADGSAT